MEASREIDFEYLLARGSYDVIVITSASSPSTTLFSNILRRIFQTQASQMIT